MLTEKTRQTRQTTLTTQTTLQKIHQTKDIFPGISVMKVKFTMKHNTNQIIIY